jgi:malonyl-CoA O-methyltransferase
VVCPDKRQVAASFSRAAASYDSVAELQRDVGSPVVAAFAGRFCSGALAGPGLRHGHFSRALAERFPTKSRGGAGYRRRHAQSRPAVGWCSHFIAGDAERLPLQDSTCDLIFSSLAVQWCADFDSVLSEAFRVLKPGGIFAFASLCAWDVVRVARQLAAGRWLVHVNRFREFARLPAVVCGQRFARCESGNQPHVLHYPDVRSLTHEFKALGAHNLNPGRPGGLTGRARILGLVEAYEQFRQARACRRLIKWCTPCWRNPYERSLFHHRN